MAENEAPEKIYYAPYGDMRENVPITDNDIEYIRTDTFIKKACEWLDKNAAMYDTNSRTEIEFFVQGFKKAMKL